MPPIAEKDRKSPVSRPMQTRGGAYPPEGHAPTRPPIGFEDVIRHYGEIGIPCWSTHGTGVDIAVALVSPLDWLNVLVLLRSHAMAGEVISDPVMQNANEALQAGGPAVGRMNAAANRELLTLHELIA